jgi:hypothetical protein
MFSVFASRYLSRSVSISRWSVASLSAFSDVMLPSMELDVLISVGWKFYSLMKSGNSFAYGLRISIYKFDKFTKLTKNYRYTNFEPLKQIKQKTKRLQGRSNSTSKLKNFSLNFAN